MKARSDNPGRAMPAFSDQGRRGAWPPHAARAEPSSVRSWQHSPWRGPLCRLATDPGDAGDRDAIDGQRARPRRARTPVLLAAALAAAAAASPGVAQRLEPLLVDHTWDRVADVPAACIDRARAAFRLSYGHTSHGSQLVSGMSVLSAASALYAYDFDGAGGALSLHDYEPTGDLGNPDRVTWERLTRALLDGAGADRNVVLWSWCGQVSSATAADIDTYTGLMSGLETDYPGVTFVYMTGHLDGTGPDGNLHQRNEQIRGHCRAGNRVLFDFADLERFDPDGADYLDRLANDACDYQGGNWADEWCAANPGACSTVSCAHSRSLNCDRKGRALWRLLAALLVEREGSCDAAVAGLRAVRRGDDVELGWDAHPADAADVWWVGSKEEIAAARAGGQPAAQGVADCVPPHPATVPTCRDAGAVPRQPAAVFYQVRPLCCAVVEGP